MAAFDSFELIAPIVGAASDVAYSPRGDLIAVVNQDEGLTLWDVARRAAASPPIKLLSRQPVSVGGADLMGIHLAFSPDARLLAVGKGDEGILTFWDPAKRVPRDPQVKLSDNIASLSFDVSGSLLAAGLSDGGLALIDPELRQPLGAPLSAADGDAHALAFSPDGRTLAAGGWGTSLILWDMRLEAWIERACKVANDVSRDEWRAIVSRTPFIDSLLKPARGCPNLATEE